MANYDELKRALLELAKECQILWDENKDMQGRFVNDLAELRRLQIAIETLNNQVIFILCVHQMCTVQKVVVGM